MCIFESEIKMLKKRIMAIFLVTSCASGLMAMQDDESPKTPTDQGIPPFDWQAAAEEYTRKIGGAKALICETDKKNQNSSDSQQ